MKIEAQKGFFEGLPAAFESSFPSTDFFYSDRFSFLQGRLSDNGGLSYAEAVFAKQQAEAWRNATALATKAAAEAGLAVLQEMLPQVAWTEAFGTPSASRQGLWAPVSFSLSANSDELESNLVQAGLNVALQTIQAIPVYGQIIQAIIGVGRLLYGIFNRPDPEIPPLTLPWARYSKDLDQDLVKELINRSSGGASADLTPIFMPPANERPWLLGEGVQNDKPVDGGQVWSPADPKTGRPDWTDGLGCMPGTARVAGTVQRILWRTTANVKLSRFFRDFMSAEIPWGSATTDTGDYYPALAQAGAGLWQQVQKAGVPLMAMVDARKAKSLWVDWFEFMFSSAWARYPVDPSSGELLAPYIAVYRKHKDSDAAPAWRLGIKNLERPSPAPFITPNIFKDGPATPATRTKCLFMEQRVPHRTSAWPWSRDDKKYPLGHESTDYRSYAYTSAKGFANVSEADRWRAVKAGISGCGLPPGELCPADLIPDGFVCVPWPTGEELLAGYGRPDEVIIGPACDRLYQLQQRCLESTLVCAVVRPFANNIGPAFAAFAGSSNTALRDKCVDMRKILLSHPARFQVRLKDVEPIDPEFHQALIASGVNNSPAQLAEKKIGAGVDQAEDKPLPSPLPPAKGVAFDDLPAQTYSLLWGAN